MQKPKADIILPPFLWGEGERLLTTTSAEVVQLMAHPVCISCILTLCSENKCTAFACMNAEVNYIAAKMSIIRADYGT